MKYVFLFLFFLNTLSFHAQQREGKSYLEKLKDSAIVLHLEYKFIEALKVNIQYLREAQNLKDTISTIDAYNAIASGYAEIGDTILAKENLFKSYKYTQLIDNDTTKANTYMDFGNFYSRGLKKLDSSLYYYKKSYKIFEKIKDSLGMAQLSYNAFYAAYDANELDNAFFYVSKLNELRKHVPYPAVLCGIDSNFSLYYAAIGNYDLSEKHVRKAIILAEKENLTKDIKDLHKTLGEILYKQKKYTEASKVLLKYIDLEEVNISVNKEKEYQDFIAKYEIEEYRNHIKFMDTKNKLQKEILKNKNLVNQFLIWVSILFICLLSILLYIIHKRKQLITTLKNKNELIIAEKNRTEKLTSQKTKLLSTISHELRTPLHGIIGISAFLLDNPELKKYSEEINSLKFSADYLHSLINDVLSYSSLDTKKNNKIILEHFDLREMTNKIVSSFDYFKTQNNNQIVINIGSEVNQYIIGDHLKLTQVLMNLIGNSCKFTENGTISLNISKLRNTSSETTLHFRVSDNGSGIPKEKLERIFEEFEQVSPNSNSKHIGSGLGLTIIKKILDLHGSKINVESTLGVGSSFFFAITFPIGNKKMAVNNRLKKELSKSNLLINKKCLVVDDNKINRLVSKKTLEKEGVLITLTSNAREAIKLLRSNTDSFDFVLMDINMPQINGYEATKIIRTFNKKIPIIALTAVDLENYQTKIHECGMDGAITKPFDIKSLNKSISKYIK
ncbi:response regulator [Aquimarina sediminis]|uniref:response regulator n=1 Tax=Aquimarina sediminis TaxID=2070536 RepID=UPI000CA0144F|nr:response regulator [Aquimarina sediminis]